MLTVQDLTYRIGDRILLDHASFSIPSGARVGLVGRNGAGKSTLFGLIRGDLVPESGEIGMPRHEALIQPRIGTINNKI